MNHFMDFDPCLIRDRNEQTHTYVDSLRLQKRLRQSRNPNSLRMTALGELGRVLTGRVKPAQ